MTKKEKKNSCGDLPAVNHKGNGKTKRPSRRLANKNVLTGNAKLIERVRQIVSETPEIRPEKIAPLLQAMEQGTYGIDARKLANILIVNLFLDP